MPEQNEESTVIGEAISGAPEEKAGAVGLIGKTWTKGKEAINAVKGHRVSGEVMAMHIDGFAIAAMLELGDLGNEGLLAFIGNVMYDTKTEEGKARYDEFMKDDMRKALIMLLLSSGLATAVAAAAPKNKAFKLAAKALVVSSDYKITRTLKLDEMLKRIFGGDFFKKAEELAEQFTDDQITSVDASDVAAK